MVRDYLGLQTAFFPYPDDASFYVGIRNGECDFGVSAVELDPRRAVCLPTCQDTSISPLTEFDASDYGTDPYVERLVGMCCLGYGVQCAPPRCVRCARRRACR